MAMTYGDVGPGFYLPCMMYDSESGSNVKDIESLQDGW
jgi:hypothetical protein